MEGGHSPLSAVHQISLALRIQLAALAKFLLAATLLSALTWLLLLLSRLGLTCAALLPTLLTALVLLASALILVHDISFCAGDPAMATTPSRSSCSPRSANFADADQLSGFRVPVDFSLSQLR